MTDLSRRRFVYGTGAAMAIGSLAGCSGNGNGTGNGNGGGDVPAAVEDHLGEANGYEGSIVDTTGTDSITIDVGAGDGLSFAPAAVRVSSGTTVTWEWTGNGGGHNVASVEGSDAEFKSEINDEEGHTFERSFDAAGVQLYVCEPHEAQGMKGGIEVV